MGLTKSERRTVVVWGCLTLGVTSVAAACSVENRNFTDSSEGGTTSLAGADGEQGGTRDSGGSTGSGATSGSSNPQAGMSAGGHDGSTGGAGSEGGSSVGSGEAGSGAGGGGGVGGSEEPVVPGPSVCDGVTQVLAVNQGYIDNFETATRFAGWYSYSDTQVPNEPKLARSASGAVTTGYKASVAVSGIQTPAQDGYGAGIGFNLLDPALSKCVDLSAFDGISFWARGGSPSNQVTFQLVVPGSQPADNQPPGDCLETCYGHPSRTFTLTTSWQRFTIPFNQLTTSPTAYAGRALMFNLVTNDSAWDISIDEVTFYKGTPPVGAISPN